METTEHELDISTHDLARRSTKSNASTILNGVNFNSRPHEEVDGRWSYRGLLR